MHQIKRWLVVHGLVILMLTPVSCGQPKAERNVSNCVAPNGVTTRSLDIHATSEPILDQLGPKEVVLTFDDGPHMWRTQNVLGALDRYCVKATFFLPGNQVKRHPKLVAKIVDRGHTVGSHSFSHAHLDELSLEDAMQEINAGRDAVRAALEKYSSPQEVSLFRFPYLATSPALTKAAEAGGFRIIDVQADGADWTRNAPTASTEMILEKLSAQDGRGIILLHDPVRNSSRRVAHLIETLAAQGYTFVNLMETSTE